MNVFYLSSLPRECAEMHCDKHVVKMIIEYAQLMSTAHRVLDGEIYIDKTANGRNIKRWKHPNSNMENTLYKASHINHPSAIWTRENRRHYDWLYAMWIFLGEEYTHRYGKEHATITKLNKVLMSLPQNIPYGKFKQPPQAMPDDCKHASSIIAYRTYYTLYKQSFAKWTNRKMPTFFLNHLRRENEKKYGNMINGLSIVRG